MSCKLCNWGADTLGDAQWIDEGGKLAPLRYASTDDIRAAAIEAHGQCAALDPKCTCQHYLPGEGRHIGPMAHVPPRCSVCYRRVAVYKKGVIAWHKTPRKDGTCQGSGNPPLVRATVPSATSSSPSSSARKKDES